MASAPAYHLNGAHGLKSVPTYLRSTDKTVWNQTYTFCSWRDSGCQWVRNNYYFGYGSATAPVNAVDGRHDTFVDARRLIVAFDKVYEPHKGTLQNNDEYPFNENPFHYVDTWNWMLTNP